MLLIHVSGNPLLHDPPVACHLILNRKESEAHRADTAHLPQWEFPLEHRLLPLILQLPWPQLCCRCPCLSSRAKYTLSSLKDFALTVPLSEMGFTWAPMWLAHSLTYLRSLLKCHFLKLFKLETSPSKLPFSLACLSFSQ